MNHFFSLKKAILLTACLFTTQGFAQSAPAETNTAQIKRSANSANPAITTLTKNLFKTESYQDNYTVQVPYQDTETYTVDVPYRVDETYSVQVPYQDTETYVENVPYTVSVPYTDYVTDYRQEYQCQTVTRYRQDCHNEQQCYIVPGSGGQQCQDVTECGTNAQGQQICKTRQVCSGSGEPQQRCENKQVCENTPYQDQDCSYVQVPYTHEVTRYRDETQYRQETRTRTVTHYREETRTRTVTKTRTETRTREVTKYRDEEKCCVTKTRQVFDRQLSFNVSVLFPQDAVLTANETETLNITLVNADVTSAQVQVQIVNSVFGYKIINQTVNGASIQVELAMAPKLDLSNAGSSSIQNLRIDYVSTSQKFQVSFTDLINSSRVQSSYSVVISDLTSGAVIEELAVTQLANGKLGAVTTATIDAQAKIKATLKVHRASILIADGALNFEASVNFEKRSLQNADVASLSDSKNISVNLIGAGLDSALEINDTTAEFSDVTTAYDIYLDLKTASGSKPLNMKTFSRDQLKATNMTAKMSDVIGYAQVSQSALKTGQTIIFTVIAKRTGSTKSVLSGKTAKAEKTAQVVLK